ncbi:MAG: inositol monophosphatase [Acidobacteria bacterium]|nr:inositol monophosphatase [Acidobacteriota bacterium]
MDLTGFRHREFLEVAIEVVRQSGELLKSNFGRRLEVERKTSAINLVTEMDVRSEDLITTLIHQRFPDHEVLAEEGKYQRPQSPYKWIIDPLDGTTNYAHGYPCFCVSVALEIEGQIQVGAVYNPLLDELFWGERGGGAYLSRFHSVERDLNQERLRVSDTADLSDSLLSTGFPYDIRTSPENNLDHFVAFATRCRAVRRDGSAALNLAYVAAGRFDGFWELKLHPWDVAAASLFVAEAGGRLSDFRGGPFSVYTHHLIASNSRIHEAMLEVLAGKFTR